MEVKKSFLGRKRTKVDLGITQKLSLHYARCKPKSLIRRTLSLKDLTCS